MPLRGRGVVVTGILLWKSGVMWRPMLLTKVPGFFKTRRDSLMKANPNAVFIFPSNEEVLRNPDVHYGFRQESNFHYLSGFEEPESFLVLAPSGSKAGTHRMILFVRKRDKEMEMWEGARYGTEGFSCRLGLPLGPDEELGA